MNINPDEQTEEVEETVVHPQEEENPDEPKQDDENGFVKEPYQPHTSKPRPSA